MKIKSKDTLADYALHREIPKYQAKVDYRHEFLFEGIEPAV